MTRNAKAWVGVCALLLVVGAGGCRRAHDRPTPAGEAAQSGIVVKDDSEGLLLTWIDDKGDFHVETRVADVPLMGRDSVRVVDPNHDEGAREDSFFVVDLRQARADGTYAVHPMARTGFEALAVARREKAGPTLASAMKPSAPGTSPSASDAVPAARPPVVIYGADWCGACHEAAKYLRQRGIAFVEKNVEKDPAAAREMQAKLTKSGLRAGSIPVIDVRGRVMVGFNAAEIDGALGAPL